MTPTPRGKERLRILLFSNLLLDRPYEWAPPAVADARRESARGALVELLGAARSHAVDVIACAGDLFDRRTVAPATIQWLIAALRSAGSRVLIAPGNRDFVGPLGGYPRHEWPHNVTIFEEARFTPVEVADGVTVWGTAHTEAHRSRGFFDGFRVDRDGVNLALFHGAERSGFDREPNLESCAPFDESAIEAAGFDHALVGHFQDSYFGRVHTYPGAPIAHDFGNGATGGAALLTLDDGRIEREYLDLASPPFHEVEIDLTGVKSEREAVKRVATCLTGRSGVLSVRLSGRLPSELVLQREDLLRAGQTADELILQWNVDVDVGLDGLEAEQTVRGQFVRDVLASATMSDERRQRVLLIGLRSLAGSDTLEGPR